MSTFYGVYPPKGGASTGTVTEIDTGTGLTGGPITTSGTISLVVPVTVADGGTGQTSLGNLTDAGTDGIVVTGGTGAVITSASLAQHVADTTHNGYLSSTDWNTFNGKQPALTIGNLTDAGTDGIVVTGGTGAVIGSGTSLAQHVADTTHNGYLSSTDWNTFNGKGSGTVTAVSVATANGLAGSSSGGATPALTLSTSVTGILQGNGTAISAATTTGSGSVVLATSPTLVTPVLGTPSSGTLTSCTGGNLTAAGTDGIAVTSGTGAVVGSGTSLAQHVADTTHNGYLSSTDWNTFNGKGAGTVTSVAATVPTFMSISGTPVTTSGTLAFTLSGTALPVLNGGTGVTTSTGSGANALATSPTLVTPVLGTPASGNLSNCTSYPIVVPGTTAGLVASAGLTGNNTQTFSANSYTAGIVGEYFEAVSTANTSVTSGTTLDVGACNITLTAGTWDVTGGCQFKPAASTAVTTLISWMGTASGTSSTGQDVQRNYAENAAASNVPGNQNVTLTLPTWRVSISTPTTYYLKGNAVFSVSTMTVNGCIRATRVL